MFFQALLSINLTKSLLCQSISYCGKTMMQMYCLGIGILFTNVKKLFFGSDPAQGYLGYS